LIFTIRKFEELTANGEKVGESVSLAESYAAVASDIKPDQDKEFALGEEGIDTSCVEEDPSDVSDDKKGKQVHFDKPRVAFKVIEGKRGATV
jgi:hypothetical protein